ncbi:hypothetical protein BDQ17DRAFT_1333830, partial [Cyathus striatus]
ILNAAQAGRTFAISEDRAFVQSFQQSESHATEDLSMVKALVKMFSAQRTMCLVIVVRVSMTYDGVTEEIFKLLLYEIFTMSTSIILSIIVSLSCFILGFASLVAAGIISEMLLPVPVVTAGITVGEN